MTRHHKDLGIAFDSLRSKGEGRGGGVRKKRRKEGGKKERGLGKEGRERLL